MATKTRRNAFHGPPGRTYAELVAVLPPRPIHDDEEFEAVVNMIGRLVGYELNADQGDYLQALMTFHDQYEAQHPRTGADLGEPSGLDLLHELLQRHEMSGADLSRLLGVSPNLGPMILRGERSITAEHARKLSQHFKLHPGVFIV